MTPDERRRAGFAVAARIRELGISVPTVALIGSWHICGGAFQTGPEEAQSLATALLDLGDVLLATEELILADVTTTDAGRMSQFHLDVMVNLEEEAQRPRSAKR